MFWFLQAAERGDASAQFNLGVMYANGTGVGPDSVEAYKWLSLAMTRSAAEEQKQYADAREILAQTMTLDQIAQAQKRAQDWTEQRGR